MFTLVSLDFWQQAKIKTNVTWFTIIENSTNKPRVSAMMGNSETRVHPKQEFPVRDLFEISDINGYVLFSDLEVNDDVLTMILSHLPPKVLLNFRLVCKNWCNLIDSEVWRVKLVLAGLGNNSRIRALNWHYLYMILDKTVIDRNLVKNPHGMGEIWRFLLFSRNYLKKFREFEALEDFKQWWQSLEKRSTAVWFGWA